MQSVFGERCNSTTVNVQLMRPAKFQFSLNKVFTIKAGDIDLNILNLALTAGDNVLNILNLAT